MPRDDLASLPFDLTEVLSDEAIRRATGSGAYVRGAGYARDGRVSKITIDASNPTTIQLTGEVQGSHYRRYLTSVQLKDGATRRGDAPRVAETWCTCPVRLECKHAAALMLAARARAARQQVHRLPVWERHLVNLLHNTTDTSTGSTAIALEFDLNRPSTSRYAGTARYDVAPRLTIRPVARGKNGSWVRSSLTWSQLRYTTGQRNFPPAHVELLQEFSRLAQDDYAYRSPTSIDLSTVSRAVWGLLDSARDIDLPMVTAGRGGAAVVVHQEPVAIRLDLGRAGPDSDLQLGADLPIGEQSVGLADVGFLGSPAHGCFTVPPDDDVGTTLARFDRRLDPALQRFFEHSSDLRIPAAEAEHFMSAYYPRLRQLACVGSADGSVQLPDISGPRLVLAVAYSGTTAALTWQFGYDVDGHRQLHALVAQAGVADVRDRAAEARMLGTLELPDEPVPLTTTVGDVRYLIPEQRLMGMDAVAFTEQTVPRLRELSEVDVEVVGEVPDFHLAESGPRIAVSATDTTDRDWFDLGVVVTVDGHEVEFTDLFTALAAGDSHLLLDSGTYFPLDDPVFETLRRLIEEARALNEQPSAA